METVKDVERKRAKVTPEPIHENTEILLENPHFLV